MEMKKIVFVFLVIILLNGCSSTTPNQDESPGREFQTGEAAQDYDLFYYIPDEMEVAAYQSLQIFLNAVNNDEISVADERFEQCFEMFLGKTTLHSLAFESFLRNTRNSRVQSYTLNYFKVNNIENSFTNTLKKLYSSAATQSSLDGKLKSRYVYNNSEFDEAINLSTWSEQSFFNGELGLLLFDNDYEAFALNGDSAAQNITLLFGGGTNSLIVMLNKYSGVEPGDVSSRLKADFYNQKYGNNWRTQELSLNGVLKRAGADKIIMAFGIGSDVVEEGTFNIYLYKGNSKTLYEISYYMNFSQKNINFSERYRIFNFILFQLFLTYLD
jgi:PBP1b-binding outer membrane lipoprotein LpoB